MKRKNIFDRPSGNIKWSEELFKIYDTNISDVIMYKLKDMNDEIIEGSFYEKELQKTKNTTGEYIIEKIIKFTLSGEDIIIHLILGLIEMI